MINFCEYISGSGNDLTLAGIIFYSSIQLSQFTRRIFASSDLNELKEFTHSPDQINGSVWLVSLLIGFAIAAKSLINSR